MDKPRIHRLAELLPMLGDADLDRMAADIKANGQRVPILLHRDGSTLDGRNRWEACRRAGVEPRCATFQGDDSELPALMLSLNVERRHLNEAQKAIAATKVAPLAKGRPSVRENGGAPPLKQAEAAALYGV